MYKRYGFCISTKEDQGFNSFELCFIVDLCGAALIFLAVKTFGKVGLEGGLSEPVAARIIKDLPAIVAHGCVHYFQYYNRWPEGLLA